MPHMPSSFLPMPLLPVRVSRAVLSLLVAGCCWTHAAHSLLALLAPLSPNAFLYLLHRVLRCRTHDDVQLDGSVYPPVPQHRGFSHASLALTQPRGTELRSPPFAARARVFVFALPYRTISGYDLAKYQQIYGHCYRGLRLRLLCTPPTHPPIHLSHPHSHQILQDGALQATHLRLRPRHTHLRR